MIEALERDADVRHDARAHSCGAITTELFAPHFLGARTEYMVAAGFDRDGRLIGFAEIAGNAERVVGILAVVRPLIGIPSVAAIVLAHNHVDCDSEPSIADIQATRQVERLTRLANVRLIDHLIFSPRSIVSMNQRGLV